MSSSAQLAMAGTRRRGMATSLRIQPPQNVQQIALNDSDASTLSSADSDIPPFQTARSSKKNMKKLSLSISSAQSSTDALPPPTPSAALTPSRPRRPSIASLPSINPTATLLHRKDEDGGSPNVPYSDGPVQIIPGIWIGSEDNARDWKGLVERGIRSILNVAKEVSSPFDANPSSQALRPAMSTPNFRDRKYPENDDPTYYPSHVPSGRPAMHYLKLQWSHGQQDLVNDGFKAGMAFADAALQRGEGCLVHCQCGISRSATMVIALVMRAAAERLSSVPPEVWALKGMQGAYSFVKEKSPCVGPNMSLIYQLLEYEKNLRGDTKGASSPPDSDSSGTDEEEEWGRRRRLLDEASDPEEDDRESALVMQEAKALDKAMEDRIVARKSSASSMSSVGSSAGSGLGMGSAWRSRYGTRKRTGSIASNKTNRSFMSEDLVEEDEEQELLGVGGGFDNDSRQSHTEESSPDDEHDGTPRRLSLMGLGMTTARPPPSAPVWKTSFTIASPPPMTALRSSFDLPAHPPMKPKPSKRRPMTLSILPPVPPSPVNLVLESDDSSVPAPAAKAPVTVIVPPTPVDRSVSSTSNSTKTSASRRSSLSTTASSTTSVALSSSSSLSLPPIRQRKESRRLVPPPLHLRESVLRKTSGASTASTSSTESATNGLNTPSQTLFVFPPSPTSMSTALATPSLAARTPSTTTLMLTSNPANPVPFPSLSTPRVSTFRSSRTGRTRSFIGLGAPPTPTVAFSKVDVRGIVGLD